MTTTRAGLPHQHGPAITPTPDTGLIRCMGLVLGTEGGERFVTPEAGWEDFDRRVVSKGRRWDEPVVRHHQAVLNGCHDVTSALIEEDPERYAHVYGYALSDDGIWRSHSWIYDRRLAQIIEPTPSERICYYGYVLSDDEAEAFRCGLGRASTSGLGGIRFFVGDAASDDESEDFAMFSGEANRAVAELVGGARIALAKGTLEEAAYAELQQGLSAIGTMWPEVEDTMVRETIAYALDAAWNKAFGHDVDQWRMLP